MIPVHKTPEAASGIVAYLARGVVVKIMGNESGWSNVILMSGESGYILSTNLIPAPSETAMNIPEI